MIIKSRLCYKCGRTGTAGFSRLVPASSGKPVGNKQDSAMRRRLEQLAEDAYPSSENPEAGKPVDALPYNRQTPAVTESAPSAMVDESDIEKLIRRIEGSEFTNQYQKEIGISQIPKYVGKQIKDTAMDDVWTGDEKAEDTVLRLLMDKHKPKRTTKVRPLITPPVPLRERVGLAKEKSLDYKLHKISNTDNAKDAAKTKTSSEEEDRHFAELYKERLLGPSLLLSDSFVGVNNSITAMANQRIEEAKQRGEFNNVTRGKPFKRDFNTENAYLDRTEYHLNNILKRQDAMPPWIEKQGSVDAAIRKFRESLDQAWRKRAIVLFSDRFPKSDLEEKLRFLNKYIKAEDRSNRSEQLRDFEWEEKQRKYLKAKLRSLNDNIRGYNLQAPLPSQKMYLDIEKELKLAYKRVAPALPEALKRHVLGGNEIDTQPQNTSIASVSLGYRDLHQRTAQSTYQVPSESLGKMILDLFRKER
ncbi:unnamed protein product [Kuraishia capsulata CBS 1993]|uniref:DnaJ homologue subfamily C member 28 conserved domain-containing protein n=1 Tax=Kuraishia capsulata CBS 1993 TaxID=1382522 RepID=W6MXD1_9ASCO|nr:uncharacterized protein KUCA_T00004664001 [Kuraishia capsulata CBS 1993]CDK28680.1 unnamed protein product [Kuraishia capsulata CBS 1993]